MWSVCTEKGCKPQMITPITLLGNTVSVVTLPTTPGFSSVEFSFTDSVAIVSSPFTGQTQAQEWPGADMWSGTVTLPVLTQAQADNWISFLMEMRGMANAVQIGDPMKASPRGVPSGTPVVDGSVSMVAGGKILATTGWTASTNNLLQPGDYIQAGFRYHRVLDVVNSDSSGKAQISIFPSLREVFPNGQPVITSNPVGLFRLGSNQRTWSTDYTGLTRLSFKILEFR